jgi:hypothetical protein
MGEIFNLFFSSDCEYTFFLTKEKDFYQKKGMRKIGVYHFEHRGNRWLFLFCKQQKNVSCFPYLRTEPRTNTYLDVQRAVKPRAVHVYASSYRTRERSDR